MTIKMLHARVEIEVFQHMQLIDSCSLELYLAKFSVVWCRLAYAIEIKSIQLHGYRSN